MDGRELMNISSDLANMTTFPITVGTSIHCKDSRDYHKLLNAARKGSLIVIDDTHERICKYDDPNETLFYCRYFVVGGIEHPEHTARRAALCHLTVFHPHNPKNEDELYNDEEDTGA